VGAAQEQQMGICRTIIFLSTVMLLMATTAVWGFSADAASYVFEYTFDDVDPIKIYAGPVTFAHLGHARDYKIACARCHHTLDEGEAAVNEHCSDCHAEPGFIRGSEAEEMVDEMLLEHYLNALHRQCIDCHRELKIEDRQRPVPLGCTECHDRSRLPVQNP
jgi:hypothetical protein